MILYAKVVGKRKNAIYSIIKEDIWMFQNMFLKKGSRTVNICTNMVSCVVCSGLLGSHNGFNRHSMIL